MQAAAYGNDSNLVLFTGEMVFPWMFEDLAGLRPLKGVAELLAQRANWSKLYDSEQLQSNEVPVVAATYVEVRCGASTSAPLLRRYRAGHGTLCPLRVKYPAQLCSCCAAAL